MNSDADNIIGLYDRNAALWNFSRGRSLFEAGWRSLIEIAALLSLNLAVFNALPLPMLDGGRAFIIFIEILRGGRRIAPEKEAIFHLTGFALLMASVLIVTYFDIARIVG